MNDPALESLVSRVYPVQKQLLEAYRSSQIPRDFYYKGLIQLAYEYAVAGYADETLMLVLQVQPSYFRTVSTTQMQGDPQFFEQAHAVAQVLQQTGLLPTQKAAPCLN